MKTKFCVLILLVAATLARGQTNSLTSLLQHGLFEEQANRNLDAAIADYQSLITRFDKDRQLAATAIFRLGECYRLQGRTNEAAVQYQRILREFADQKRLATLSRRDLAGLGISIAVAESSNAVVSGPNNAEDQEIQRIQQMLQNSPDLINAPGPGGLTPLQSAASLGQLLVAEYLLNHGADVNRGSANYSPPLFLAANAGHNAMVKLLLNHGADVNVRNAAGWTPLYDVAGRGYAIVAKTLIEHKADVNARAKDGRTPLHQAADSGHLALVRLLLAHGANVNATDHDGHTPLMVAAMNTSNLAVIKALLAANADTAPQDKNGRTALSYAVQKGGEPYVKALLDAKANPNLGKLDAPLLCAIHNRDGASAKLVLQAGADPNAKGKVDWNVMHNTSQPNAEPGQPAVTPLFLAVREKQIPMVRLLLKFKADPNDSKSDRRPLLFYTLSETNILQALLDAGANVDRIDPVAMHGTPLDTAIDQNNTAAVEILLKHGANPNAQNPGGYTPLHFAAYNLAPRKTFVLLLDHHANPNVRAKANNGKTPLDVLKQKEQQENAEQRHEAAQLADLLRQHGALDHLPDWDRIEVSRPSTHYSATIFRKSTNDWNQFTLFGLLGVQYNLLTASTKGQHRGSNHNYTHSSHNNSLSYPDFSRIVIHRPSPGGTNWSDLKVNLAGALDSGDCSANVPLHFGDVVEIPEADHVMNEPWAGLNTNELFTLKKCLTRHVQITVKGHTTTLTVQPQVEKGRPGSVGFINVDVESPASQTLRNASAQFTPQINVLEFEPFMLWPVLKHSKLLLSSSDLAHIHVQRRDPATGKLHEWTVDCSNPNSPPDFWLRDGDRIEVPEK